MNAQDDRKEYFVKILTEVINDRKADILRQWNNPIGTKTRHFFIDNLLPEEDVNKIYNAFPKNGEGFFDRESFREKKRTSAAKDCL